MKDCLKVFVLIFLRFSFPVFEVFEWDHKRRLHYQINRAGNFIQLLFDLSTESISLDIHDGTSDLAVSTADGIAAILMPPPQTPASTFPLSIPSWAARLNNCEVSMSFSLHCLEMNLVAK